MTDTQVTPQYLASERALLGGLIVSSESRNEILALVKPSHYFSDIHQTIAHTIARLAFDGRLNGGEDSNTTLILNAIDATGIGPELTGGIIGFMLDLMKDHEPRFVDYHAGRVIAAALQRKLIHDLQDSINSAMDGESPAQICERLIVTADTIREELTPRIDDKWFTSKEFNEASYPTEYFIPGILAKQQFAIIGGPSKGCKTTLILDLGLSLASADRFFNEFQVTRPVKVGIVSAESGPGTLQETARRIAKTKRLTNLGDYENLFWKFDLPILTDPSAISRLIQWVNDKQLEFLILDPFYLMAGLTENAANMFVVGQLLASLQTVGETTGVTIGIAHHFKNLTFMDQYAAPELGMLAWSGFSQYARQWLLLNRREKYDPETGLHKLWLAVGGSAGHGGLFSVDAHEGRQSAPWGRVWEVSVSKASEARQQERQEKEQRKSEEQDTKFQRDTETVLDVLARSPDGITKSLLRDVSGVGAKINKILLAIVTNRQAEPCRVKASNGQSYDGFRITRTLGQPLGQIELSECPTDSTHTLGQRPPLRGRDRPSGVSARGHGSDGDRINEAFVGEA